MLAAQATGTQIEPFRFTIDNNRGWLNVGQPTSFSMLLGVAYLIAKADCFAAEVAFSSQIVNSFYTR